MGDPAETDDRELARAGYRPQFRRGLGSFTAFAAGFSYLSILTGIPQDFFLGYREAGPAFVWTWPVVFLGQFCLAACFADLVRAYPFCGGVYAWARRAGSSVVGWVYLASLIVTLAAVTLAWQIVLPAAAAVLGGLLLLVVLMGAPLYTLVALTVGVGVYACLRPGRTVPGDAR